MEAAIFLAFSFIGCAKVQNIREKAESGIGIMTETQ